MGWGPPQGEQLGPRGGSGQGPKTAFNTRHLGMTHWKELNHSRPMPGGHPLVAESWEGLGGSGGRAGWQGRGTWGTQGKSHLSTILEIFLYFYNPCILGEYRTGTRDSHRQQGTGAMFLKEQSSDRRQISEANPEPRQGGWVCELRARGGWESPTEEGR